MKNKRTQYSAETFINAFQLDDITVSETEARSIAADFQPWFLPGDSLPHLPGKPDQFSLGDLCRWCAGNSGFPAIVNGEVRNARALKRVKPGFRYGDDIREWNESKRRSACEATGATA